jgi:hypothetical protein
MQLALPVQHSGVQQKVRDPMRLVPQLGNIDGLPSRYRDMDKEY